MNAMKELRVKGGGAVRLSKIDPQGTPGFSGNKSDGEAALEKIRARLIELQEVLYAEHKQKILIVLQGMDTSGKDGVIRHVFEGVNPQGVRTVAFKVPSAEELDHDFLWRVHAKVPARGELAIFNRSHYEDVLVVRVHDLVPEEIWSKRYDQINEFEKILSETGTTILKFFLHIDKDEQKERLQARLDDESKRWKFNTGDLDERKLWAKYQKAYEDVLNKTSTSHAPWYVVPANRKWYRNIAIAQTIVEALEKLKMKYPPADDLSGVVID
jgi:PPK2 family polyphosphate:nucleotide phosphotransferase